MMKRKRPRSTAQGIKASDQPKVVRRNRTNDPRGPFRPQSMVGKMFARLESGKRIPMYRLFDGFQNCHAEGLISDLRRAGRKLGTFQVLRFPDRTFQMRLTKAKRGRQSAKGDLAV
jgi:hypothetical protein